ncbi:pyridoxine 5'-phosphate synthase [Candidatus Riflebacteria bacterium]
MKLSVNIDHIATLRNARGEEYPSPAEGARLAEKYGAHGITLHIRGDRRHVNERDFEQIKSRCGIKLTLEMANTRQMRKLALQYKPHQVTLVPEKKKEITTEGGLQLKEALGPGISELKRAGLQVSLFIEPEPTCMDFVKKLGADIIELHTGSFAESCKTKEKANIDRELIRLKETAIAAQRLGIIVHAGHGLTCENVGFLKNLDLIEELSIGHAIVSRAIFVGWKMAIGEILEIISEPKFY